MNQERDLARAHIAPSAPAHDDELAPGRGSRSSQMNAPANPLVGGLLQRKARDANGVAEDADAAVASAASSAGASLPEPIMRKFESSLGADLSSVRVHTGSESQAAAASVGAQAYTIGQDIHFGAGHYDPSGSAGQHLLAHEVAHTVQQRGATPTRQNRLEVSLPGDASEIEADHAADAMVIGAPSALTAREAQVARKDEPAVPDASEDAPAAAGGLDPDIRTALLHGSYDAAGKAAYSEVEEKKGTPARTVKVFEKFIDPKLQHALEYVMKKLAGASAIEGTGSGKGDSDAKAVDTHPAWVSRLQLALSLEQALTKGADKRANKAQTGGKAKPQWSEDSEVAQHILQAYLLEWTRRINDGKEAPANVSELFGRAGDSKDNERARLLGGEPGGYNWCGPASERSAALGIMRKRLRFQGAPKILASDKTKPKDPGENATPEHKQSYDKKLAQAHALAFQNEVVHQGSLFLTNWAQYKDKTGQGQKRPKASEDGFRGVAGKEAEILPLEPGDYIYLCAKNSPLSGHVATIIREEWTGPSSIDRDKTPAGTILSKIYYVSGNAGPVAGGAVRVEQVQRELPPKNFAYFTVAAWGNQYDFRKFKVSTLNSQANTKYVNKMNSLFIAAAFAEKNSIFNKNGFKIAEYFQAHWRDLAAMSPHLGGKVAEYEELLNGYNQDFLPKINAAQKDVDAYATKMRALGLPFDKRDPGFAKINTDMRTMPVKIDLLSKMSTLFMTWAAKTKFMDGKAADYVKWYGENKYNGSVMEDTMGGDKGKEYRALLDTFMLEQQPEQPEVKPEPNKDAKPSHDVEVPTRLEPADDMNDESEKQEQKAAETKAQQPSPTGNFSPTEEGHIWVTSILRAGAIDPAKLEAEIKSAQAAASRGAIADLDPSASAPGTDNDKIRQQVLQKWGLEDMQGTIDSLWPGALEYWEGLGAFS